MYCHALFCVLRPLYNPLLVLLLAGMLVGCKIEVIIPPEGGWVTYEIFEGKEVVETDHCRETCTIDLAYPNQHVRFYPRPFGFPDGELGVNEWGFGGWKRGQYFICDTDANAFDYCGFDVGLFSGADNLAELLASGLTLKVEPNFIRVPLDDQNESFTNSEHIEANGQIIGQGQKYFDFDYYRFSVPYRGSISFYLEGLPAQSGVGGLGLYSENQLISGATDGGRAIGDRSIQWSRLDRRILAGDYVVSVTTEALGAYYRLTHRFEGVPVDYQLSTIDSTLAIPGNTLLLAAITDRLNTTLVAADNNLIERIQLDLGLDEKDQYVLENTTWYANSAVISVTTGFRAEPASISFGDNVTLEVLEYGSGRALVELGTLQFELTIPRSDQLLALNLWEDTKNGELALHEQQLTTDAQTAADATRYGSILISMLACAVAESPVVSDSIIDTDIRSQFALAAENACSSPLLARTTGRLDAATLDNQRVVDIPREVCTTRTETNGQCLASALTAWKGEFADENRLKIVFPAVGERELLPGDVVQLFTSVRGSGSDLERLRWYSGGVLSPVVDDIAPSWEVSENLPLIIRAEAEFADGTIASDSIVIEAAQ